MYKNTFKVAICAFIKLTLLLCKRSLLQWPCWVEKGLVCHLRDVFLGISHQVTPYIASPQCAEKIAWEIGQSKLLLVLKRGKNKTNMHLLSTVSYVF